MSLTEPCPQCRKKGEDSKGDNLVVHPQYGYKKCFACNYFESINRPLVGKYLPIADRGLTKEVCEKYGIQIVNYTGKFYVGKEPLEVSEERCVAFNYYGTGSSVVKQKIRSCANKKAQKILGDTKANLGLWGKFAFSPTEKLPIVITEGEYDAASVWQATGIPAVSLPNGSGSAGNLANDLEWLQQWKHVVLLFDNDEAGHEAVEKAVAVLPVGRVRIGKLPLKDANDMLMEGKAAELKSAIWNAEMRKPKSIVTPCDILEDVLKKPELGIRLPYAFLNDGMYGLQPHHIYAIAGSAQVGKTEFLKEIIFHLLYKEEQRVGMYSLEQGAASTVQRMVGGMLNRKLHLPGGDYWDTEQIKEHALKLQDKLYLYHNGSNESLTLEALLINIRYMYHCYGIKVIVLDNLTAMCHTPNIEGKYVGKYIYIGHIMNKLFTLTRELPISLILVSHLNNDAVSKQIHIPTSKQNKASYLMIGADEMDQMLNKPGLDWNSGRMPGLGNLDGSDVVAKLADYVIGLARDTINKSDIIRRTLKVKFLKTRLDSAFCGKEFKLLYDYDTGRYAE